MRGWRWSDHEAARRGARRRVTGATLLGVLGLAGVLVGPGPALAEAADPAAPVVGGTAAPDGLPRLPIVALVAAGSDAASGTFCTGTVVAPTWVLTADHCVAEPFDVRYGATDLRIAGQVRTVTGVDVDPDLDIALVALDRPFDEVTPARFAVPGIDVLHQPGAVVEVWGWGRSESRPGGPADTTDGRLHSAPVTVRPDATCERLYGTGSAALLCAGNADAGTGAPPVGACPGDSGGPVVAGAVRPGGGFDEIVVGVVSGGGATCGDGPFVAGEVAAIGLRIEAVTGRSVAPYPDIVGLPLRSAVEAVTAAGIVGGYPDGTFGPARPVTRGQMATFVTRAVDLGTPTPRTFDDIEGSPHRAAIETLAGAGIVSGFGDGTFRPNENISRAQLATYLVRAAALPLSGSDPAITDVPAGAAHAETIAAAVAAGILDLEPAGIFRPAERPTRADLADAITRLLRR